MTTAELPVPDYLSRLRLDGRNYLVVGAGQGMGRQTAHALAQAGAAKIMCVDVEADRAKEIADERQRRRRVAIGMPWIGDVTSAAEVRRASAGRRGDHRRRAHRRVRRHRGHGPLGERCSRVDDETWDWEFDICLRHAYLLAQEVGRAMVANGGGTMVFIASVSGLTSGPDARRLRGGQGGADGVGPVGRRSSSAGTACGPTPSRRARS